MQILNLKAEPEHLKTLAEWHHNEWAYLNPTGSLSDRIRKMSEYLNDEFIPSTLIAKERGELIGSAALIESDMDSHKELTPWLASVFVKPSHRGKGVGSLLVKHVMDVAKENGMKELYLFTPSEEHFYKQLGWDRFAKEDYRGSLVTIMSTKLNG
jgi:N-acetylglutamate synthase-like GNAT family acetyltransferase